MVDKISVNPLGVRCLGNIVSPKTVSDFNEYYCNLSSGTDTIDGVSRTVYTSEYKVGSTITLEYTNLIGTTDASFTVKCTLKNNSNTAINGATVYLDVNDTVLNGTTNSSGVYTFTVNTDGSSKYRFKAYYQGTSSLAGCLANGVVYSADADTIDLLVDKPIIQDDDTTHLIAILSDGEMRVPGQSIKFYEVYEPTYLTVTSTPSIIQSGETATIKAILRDEDGSRIKGETIKIYDVSEE